MFTFIKQLFCNHIWKYKTDFDTREDYKECVLCRKQIFIPYIEDECIEYIRDRT